jgi:hypothetical protein
MREVGGRLAERTNFVVQRLIAFAGIQPLQRPPVCSSKQVSDIGDFFFSTTGPQVKIGGDEPNDPPQVIADLASSNCLYQSLRERRDVMPERRDRSTCLPKSKGRASLPRLLRKVVIGSQRATWIKEDGGGSQVGY